MNSIQFTWAYHAGKEVPFLILKVKQPSLNVNVSKLARMSFAAKGETMVLLTAVQTSQRQDTWDWMVIRQWYLIPGRLQKWIGTIKAPGSRTLGILIH